MYVTWQVGILLANQFDVKPAWHEEFCREGCVYMTWQDAFKPTSLQNKPTALISTLHLQIIQNHLPEHVHTWALLSFSVTHPHRKTSNCILEMPGFSASIGSVSNQILQVQCYNDKGEFLLQTSTPAFCLKVFLWEHSSHVTNTSSHSLHAVKTVLERMQ